MKIAVACDHGGLVLKNVLLRYLAQNGYDAVDFGTDCTDSCDYPDFALPAAEAVASGECERGILVCSTGIGISIAANKVPSIRCAHCHDGKIYPSAQRRQYACLRTEDHRRRADARNRRNFSEYPV